MFFWEQQTGRKWLIKLVYFQTFLDNQNTIQTLLITFLPFLLFPNNIPRNFPIFPKGKSREDPLLTIHCTGLDCWVNYPLQEQELLTVSSLVSLCCSAGCVWSTKTELFIVLTLITQQLQTSLADLSLTSLPTLLISGSRLHYYLEKAGGHTAEFLPPIIFLPFSWLLT